MKKLLTKLVFSVMLLSLGCFYSGGMMAMAMEANGATDCAHCYSHTSFSCDLDEAVMPPSFGGDDPDKSNYDNFSFKSYDSINKSLSRRLFDRPPYKGQLISAYFINNKVVLLI